MTPAWWEADDLSYLVSHVLLYVRVARRAMGRSVEEVARASDRQSTRRDGADGLIPTRDAIGQCVPEWVATRSCYPPAMKATTT